MRTLLTIALPFALLACSGEKGEETEGPDLTDTFGTIDGTLDLFGEDIAFASGVAYGDSFFHGDYNVLVITQWDDSQCGNGSDFIAWESSGEGYRVEIAFDDSGNAVGEESTVWSCDEPEMCGGAVNQPEVELTFDSMELEVGGSVKGSALIKDYGGKETIGTLEFDMTYCGEG